MEFTIHQALLSGIKAHKAGNIHEADQFFTAILKDHPKHPDANHNMGTLAISIGRVEDALPFLEQALASDPNNIQFWFSYVDALIEANHLAHAFELLKEAKRSGVRGTGFDEREKKLFALGIDETQFPKDSCPSEREMNELINLYHKGELQECMHKINDLLQRFPKSPVIWNIRGSVRAGQKQFNDAIVSYKKSLSLKPGIAEVHNNIGIALHQKGSTGEAVLSYNKALSINPSYADAYNNMGIALKDQGMHTEAIKSYTQALTFSPKNVVSYYNIGVALQAQGKHKEAMLYYRKGLGIQPNFVEALNNLGIALREQGKLNEAIQKYRKAIFVKPQHAAAHNNMGIALKDQGKHQEAIEAYEIALSLNCKYFQAQNNKGIVLQKCGKMKEAIKAYRQALEINPDFREAWNNLLVPLFIKKEPTTSPISPLLGLCKKVNFHSVKTEKSLLNYKLNLGEEDIEIYFKDAVSNLSNAKNLIIKNPQSTIYHKSARPQLPDKTVALVHFGRSGTGLLHSLIDNHPEVSTLPSIYFSEYFNHDQWLKLIAGGWDGLVDSFTAIYEVLFDASDRCPVATKSGKVNYYLGQKEGMANVGDNRDEVLKVDKKVFSNELKGLINFYTYLDASKFFELVHCAYNKALKDRRRKSLLFYHIHNPDARSYLNFINSKRLVNWLVLVREPIQSCESWIRDCFEANDHLGCSTSIVHMLFEIDKIIYRKQNSIGVRLEDLKERPRKTIPALCKWMNIAENETLYEMTAQGKRWWGDPSSPDFDIDGMEPFGQTSIKRRTGSIFSADDQFILQTLFYPFSMRFGYVEENLEQFKKDLKSIKPMLNNTFDFEKAMTKRSDVDLANFKKSDSYLYLRTGLFQRWETLNRNYTYPNMISPLALD